MRSRRVYTLALTAVTVAAYTAWDRGTWDAARAIACVACALVVYVAVVATGRR